MLLALLLAAPLQDLPAAETVQREVRLHGVAGLIARPDARIIYSDLGAHMRLYPQPPLQWLPQPSLSEKNALTWLLGVQNEIQGDDGRFASVSELEQLAARFCQPPLDPKWERIQADETGWLIGYLRPEQHAWLERFLQLQSAPERRWMAQIETHWFRLTPRQVARLGLEGSAQILADAAEVAAQIAVLSSNNGEALTSPRVTAFAGQLAELSVLNEISYVKEYRLEIVEPGRQEIADPVVDVIQEGHRMEVRALQTGDELYGLRLSCSSAEIERPIPTRRFQLSPVLPSEVEVAMPQVLTAQVDATVLVPDGGGVLLLTSGLSDGGSLAIVVQFRRIPAPDANVEADER